VIRESRAASNRPFGKSYVRTISSIEREADRFTERGTWVRPPHLRGDYTVVWQRTVEENGVPSIRVVSEKF
jgi:hypothetical protein